MACTDTQKSSPLNVAPHHDWLMIAAGRVCRECYEAQALSEFDDSTPCEAAIARMAKDAARRDRTTDGTKPNAKARTVPGTEIPEMYRTADNQEAPRNRPA
jgi:hypothetical protein